MNRYEFEIMTYLERCKEQDYALRAISDSLKISGTMISKSLEVLEKNKWIQKNGNKIKVTEEGMEALEPYRVRKAVVMAAGFGSRMMPATSDRPKPLVTVNGIRILDTLLDALVRVGIEDITIVRGYKKERFDELLGKYPFLKLVDNDE